MNVEHLFCGNITRKLQNNMLFWQVSWLILLTNAFPSAVPTVAFCWRVL